MRFRKTFCVGGVLVIIVSLFWIAGDVGAQCVPGSRANPGGNGGGNIPERIIAPWVGAYVPGGVIGGGSLGRMPIIIATLMLNVVILILSRVRGHVIQVMLSLMPLVIQMLVFGVKREGGSIIELG